MRELTFAETTEVSGGTAKSFGDALAGAVVGCVAGASEGMMIGGIHGGDGGGIFGIGAIGQLVGLFIPTIQGAIAGTVMGAAVGLQDGEPVLINWINQVGAGTAGQQNNH
ncbi:hypothetical protein AA0473_1051 [Acetobacter orleanensis NRIC 0473]|uniref:DUF5862 family protein n=1 Tax=Acetobacter orleanensis TaxID=104099 RepID=UPI000777F1BA|nr:hypothetical protein [Acetobacter orleanensis]KXV67011.1 hypothetical protein AD949_00890 [Acetobacter orleanensis]PCD78292.1 colicin V synthesis protein [Acetobacter orleanensis]GBR26059.1 hypothetical protein AA0473_1051 [Acetobacter orleanensis NRIC 0473]